MESVRRRAPWRERNVVAIGVVSLLNDLASEMVVPLLPFFLTVTLKAGAASLGWVEGGADFTAAIAKLVAGGLSDRSGKARPLVLAGYGLPTLVRPLIALATVPWHVVAVRVGDRIGKGIRTAPRDALLVAYVSEQDRGAAFGFHRAMDHGGAFGGAVLAFLFLYFVSDDLRWLFALSVIPALLAVLALFFFVRDFQKPSAAASKLWPSVRPSWPLVKFLVPAGLFALGQMSDTFLLLRIGVDETALYQIPLWWAALHVIKSVTSTPGGRLVDRWGAVPVMAVGWSVAAIAFFAFAVDDGGWAGKALFVVYGVHYGLAEAAGRTLTSRYAKAEATGSALGWYHLVTGIAVLPANLVFGALWDVAGAGVAFALSAALCTLAIAVLVLLVRPLDGARRST